MTATNMTQDLTHIEAVVLDIEGTICPITFVHQTLFPYAVNALPKVLKEKWNDPKFVPFRDDFPDEHKASPEALEAHVKDLTERDVKIAYLKNLQGYLWQEGYETGVYSTPLYEDVIPAMEKWQSKGISNSIYSSGSVFAQKLLFSYVKDNTSSDANSSLDKKALVHQWWDTLNAGPKMESYSYEKIAKGLDKDVKNVLFFSDNVKEIQAATEAGMQAIVVERPGNSPLKDEDRTVYQVITSLDQVGL